QPVAVLSQDLAGDRADGVLVLDEEDRLPPCGRGGLARALPGHEQGGVGPRQVDLERGALALLALNLDVAARLLDDAVSGQVQALGSHPRASTRRSVPLALAWQET